MKKIVAILLALIMVIGMTACNGDVEKPTEPSVTETPATDAVTEPITDPVAPTDPVVETPELCETSQHLVALFDACSTEFPVVTMQVDLNDADAFKSFTGLDNTDGVVEVSVTEPAMSSQAYSVVLVKVAEGADAEAILTAMEEGINPRKWICVEADSIESVIVDDYILFAMCDSSLKNAKDIVDAFVVMLNNAADAESGAEATEAVVEDGTANDDGAVVPETEGATEAPAAEG